MKPLKIIAALATASILAACGGGGSQSALPISPQSTTPQIANAPQLAQPTQAQVDSMGNPLVTVASNYRQVCGTPQPGYAQCLAYVRTDVDGGAASATHDMAQSPDATSSGYGPSQLQAAYNLPSSTAGSGQTVALVESGNYPTAAADLATYRSKYGLPACTVANGCFKKVGQTGTSKLPAKNASWAEETALDMDMVSAICPKCHILIVEANSSSNANLEAAENTAANLGATEISNSYGGSETGASNAAYNHPGIIITASSGDSGPGVSQPCTYATVVCTGGTTLKSASNARGYTETIWSDAGGGCSADVAKPSWQSSYTKCGKRVAPDTAFDANPNTGVAVYDSTPYEGSSGWMVFGGTSVASPAISAVYALAGNAASLDAAQSIWQHAGTSALYEIGGAYSTYAGWGTPDGTAAF